MPPARLDLGLGLVELLLRAGDEDRDPAGGGDLQRGGAADAARGAGDDHGLAVDRALERAVLEQVGVEVALPVVPQLVGVGLERRQLDARALAARAAVSRASKLRRRARCSRATSSGMPRSARTAARGSSLSAGQLHRVAAARPSGSMSRHPLVDPHDRRAARAPALGERVHAPRRRAAPLRVDEVERLAVEARPGGRCGPSRRRRSRPARCSSSPTRGRPAGTTPAARARTFWIALKK